MTAWTLPSGSNQSTRSFVPGPAACDIRRHRLLTAALPVVGRTEGVERCIEVVWDVPLVSRRSSDVLL